MGGKREAEPIRFGHEGGFLPARARPRPRPARRPSRMPRPSPESYAAAERGLVPERPSRRPRRRPGTPQVSRSSLGHPEAGEPAHPRADRHPDRPRNFLTAWELRRRFLYPAPGAPGRRLPAGAVPEGAGRPPGVPEGRQPGDLGQSRLSGAGRGGGAGVGGGCRREGRQVGPRPAATPDPRPPTPRMCGSAAVARAGPGPVAPAGRELCRPGGVSARLEGAAGGGARGRDRYPVGLGPWPPDSERRWEEKLRAPGSGGAAERLVALREAGRRRPERFSFFKGESRCAAPK